MAWPIFLVDNGGGLAENKYLKIHYNGIEVKEVEAGKGMPESPKKNTLVRAGLLRDEVAMREAAKRETDKQQREIQQAARVKSASAKASKRVRGEVLRAFEKWYVVEVVT